MPRFFFCALMLALLIVCSCETAQCASLPQRNGLSGAKPRWRVDHYVYDALLRRSWAVLVDEDHPETPARMVPVRGITSVKKKETLHGKVPDEPRTVVADLNKPAMRRWNAPEITAGARVEVANPAGSQAQFLLSGRAIEPGYAEQTIRIRLNTTGSIVRAGVRGPHLVVLVALARPVWGRP